MFKVIKIISDKRIVINAGKNEVQTGDILRVIEKNSEEIVDPDTIETLRQREVTSPLNVNLSQITGGYNIDNKLIEIGDLVELL